MYEYRGYVRKIYDGDTITVDIDLGFGIVFKGQKLRLLRLNAPEVRGEQRPEGLKSRDALRELIGNKWVTIRTTKDKKGKYGRWLAEVLIDQNDTQLNVNDWLITEGYADPLE
jgi:micrococcal nuclease